MKTAQTATTGFIQSLEASAKKRKALTDLGNTAGVMGLAFATAAAATVFFAARFDQSMSKVQAATHESAANMNLLRDAAIEAGKVTVFSAEDAAAAEESLAKAGVKTADILSGGLKGAMSLAAAGGQDVADAAESAAMAMTQFGLSGADVPHIADLLAAAAGKAQGEVSDLSMALKQSGLVANQTGLSIEETTGALAAFASAGLIGSDAGTSLKTMLQALTPTSAKAASLMEQLGISAYDSQGNFIGLANYAGVLADGLAGMSKEQQNAALKTLFGSDAVRAATVLYTQGADGMAKWITKVNDTGYAAETAAIKMDNLAGDLEQLKGSLETAFITTGEGAQSPIRGLTQDLTGLTNAYIDLPGPVKSSGLEIVTFLAILGGGGFVFTRVVTGLAAMQEAMAILGLASGKLSGRLVAVRGGALAAGVGLKIFSDSLDSSNQSLKVASDLAGDMAIGFAVGGPWGAAIGGAVGLLDQLFTSTQAEQQSQADLASATTQVAGTLNAETGAITGATKAWVSHRLVTTGALDDARKLGLSLDLVMKAAEGDPAAMKLVNTQIGLIAENMSLIDGGHVSDTAQTLIHFNDILGNTTGATDAAAHHIQQLNLVAAGAVPSVRAMGAALTDQGNTASGAASSSRSLGAATDETTAKMAKEISTAKGLVAALDDLNTANLDARSTARDWAASIDAATAALRKNGKTLNNNTAQGRENNTVLDAMASAAISHAAAMQKDGKSLTQVNGYLVMSHDRLVSTAQAFGMSAGQAETYANKVLGIPKSVATKVSAPGLDHANSAAGDLIDKANQLDGMTSTVHIFYELSTIGSPPSHIGVPGHARGGLIRGRGTDTSDSNLVAVSNREFIINAAASSRHLGLLTAINKGTFRGMARGGYTGPASPPPDHSNEPTTVQIADMIAAAFKHFGFGPKATASTVKDELHTLIAALRDALGKDSPLLDHVKRLGDRLVDAAKAQDRATAMLDNLQQKETELARTVAATFRHDPFGMGSEGLLTQLKADKNDARKMHQALRKAKHKGLDGGLFAALAASGDLDTAQQLAAMSPQEIHKYEQAWKARQKATANLGQFAGNTMFGAAIKRQTQVLNHLDHQITHLQHAIDHLGGHVKQGAKEGTRDGAAQGMREQGHRAHVGTR
jgi:TP901 family phage tail tape measure protein